MEDQKTIADKGGTMRLGAYPCKLAEGSLAHQVYERRDISERHRHRYEFNNEYLAAYGKAGMLASGINPKGRLVEIVEIKDHPWFIGVQFHPEYRSTVAKPHPLFIGFVQAAVKQGAAKGAKGAKAEA
jgi:CTP synthase